MTDKELANQVKQFEYFMLFNAGLDLNFYYFIDYKNRVKSIHPDSEADIYLGLEDSRN